METFNEGIIIVSITYTFHEKDVFLSNIYSAKNNTILLLVNALSKSKHNKLRFHLSWTNPSQEAGSEIYPKLALTGSETEFIFLV